MPEGNCYATSEAVYHLLGGKAAGWKPMRLNQSHGGEDHWFLQHESGLRIDLTASQYDQPIDYSTAIGCGFMTKQPSKAARAMMHRMVWKDGTPIPDPSNSSEN